MSDNGQPTGPSVRPSPLEPVRNWYRKAIIQGGPGKLARAWWMYPGQARALRSFPADSPILVTGTHRSGTTWAGQMLSPPGLWLVHEPFNPVYGAWDEFFSYPASDGRKQRAASLMRDLLAGRKTHLAQQPYCRSAWMPLRLFKAPVKRVLIKDPIACLMSEYLVHAFDMQALVLFRHPAGFVHSMTQLDWPTCHDISNMLANEALMADWLHPYESMMRQYSDRESLQSKAVLHGCLNVVLWGYAQRNDRMLAMRWEDLCMQPVDAFKRLYTCFRLPYHKDVAKKHAAFCLGSGSDNHRAWETQRNSKQQAWKWKNGLSRMEIESIREIWSHFNIPLYDAEENWDPQHHALEPHPA